MTCLRQKDKPKMCVDFPETAAHIKKFDKCTYVFDKDGNRSGYCCDCEQCCVNMRWGDEKDKICRHLKS